MLHHSLSQSLEGIAKKGLYRSRSVMPIQDEGINFSSNDYLSLTQESAIRSAYAEGYLNYPVGSGGSSLLSGYHSVHEHLEQAFARALNVEDCVLFTSGYAANLSIAAFLKNYNLPLLIDKAVHASIYDGISAYSLKFSRYCHNDLGDFFQRLKSLSSSTVIMTESIFSMSGEEPPLHDLAAAIENHDHLLFVDEAHGFGVLGPEGLGGVHKYALSQSVVPLRVIPFGKAMASSGAIIAGQKIFIEALIQSARPLIYSTAMSPAHAFGLLKTFEFIRQADDRRAHLFNLIAYFREKIIHSSFKFRDSCAPIQQLFLGSPFLSLNLAESLRSQGFFCSVIRQPTVSKKDTGLKIVLNYAHKFEDIDALFRCLAKEIRNAS